LASITQLQRIRLGVFTRLRRHLDSVESAARRAIRTTNSLRKKYSLGSDSVSRRNPGIPTMEDLNRVASQIPALLDAVDVLVRGMEDATDIFEQPV